jgi:tRNA(fMet)-specific endonuclease VapC
MGLLIDTDVWILAEKSDRPLNLSRWAKHGSAYMSVITVSELLVGVEKANSPQRRAHRAAFVESLISLIPSLEVTTSIARTHARMMAGLPKNITAGSHDSLIAATAMHHGYAVLTRNADHFRIFAGLTVEPFDLA